MSRFCFKKLNPSCAVPLEHTLRIPVKVLDKLWILQLFSDDIFNIPNMHIKCLDVFLIWYRDGVLFELWCIN